MRIFTVVIAAFPASCWEATPPPAADLHKPAADLLQDCPDPVRIPPPACEADKKCRADKFYGPDRIQYVQCRDKVRGLQRYVSVITEKTP